MQSRLPSSNTNLIDLQAGSNHHFSSLSYAICCQIRRLPRELVDPAIAHRTQRIHVAPICRHNPITNPPRQIFNHTTPKYIIANGPSFSLDSKLKPPADSILSIAPVLKLYE